MDEQGSGAKPGATRHALWPAHPHLFVWRGAAVPDAHPARRAHQRGAGVPGGHARAWDRGVDHLDPAAWLRADADAVGRSAGGGAGGGVGAWGGVWAHGASRWPKASGGRWGTCSPRGQRGGARSFGRPGGLAWWRWSMTRRPGSWLGLRSRRFSPRTSCLASLPVCPLMPTWVCFALLGLPLYVCASGATPLAAAIIFAGASPGAAVAFPVGRTSQQCHHAGHLVKDARQAAGLGLWVKRRGCWRWGLAWGSTPCWG